MTDDDELLQMLETLEYFCPSFFKLRTKSGSLELFELNRAQLYLHKILETQLRETKKVRAIILKGRQMGCSTYIQARFLHKTLMNSGIKAFILTHELEATKTLFDMTKRFYEHLPAGLAPLAERNSSRELLFSSIASGYSVGTAGNKATGRSQSLQLVHGCLAKGTLVIDEYNNVREIESFKVGDTILTHKANHAQISHISTQTKSCKKIMLRGLTAFPLLATGEHKFYTQSGWKELCDLIVGDEIGYPVRTIAHNLLDVQIDQFKVESGYEIGRLFGLYLAAGHIKEGAACISVKDSDVTLLLRYVRPFSDSIDDIKVKHRPNRKATVCIYSDVVSRLIDKTCGQSNDKHFPHDWFLRGDGFAKGLLHGFIGDDNQSYDNDRRIRVASVCKSLVITARDITASLGYGWAGISCMNITKHPTYKYSLCGHGVNKIAKELGKQVIEISRRQTDSKKNNAAKEIEIKNGYAWLRITSIQDAGMHEVYDFEVDHEDHSYCTIHAASHNSEVAFWPNALDHAQGLLQAVSNSDNTEIILESTPNGVGNYFFDMWRSAENGTSDFVPIFLPWYWMSEYQIDSRDELRTDEEEILKLYQHDGMTKQHIYFRRKKIYELSQDYDQGALFFQKEYPLNAVEAFAQTGEDKFILSRFVQRARANDFYSESPLIIGVDPAISDNDRCVICRRRGRKIVDFDIMKNHNTMQIAGRLRHLIETERPKKVFIDQIGIGAGVVDRLQEMGFSCVEGISVSRAASDREKYANLRAELWAMMREWFESDMDVDIPDRDDFERDLCSVTYRYRSNGQLILDSKDDMRKKGIRSPDLADAASLTFVLGNAAYTDNNYKSYVDTNRFNSMFT